MILAASAFLFVAQGGSVLASMNDRDFCAALTRNVPTYTGQSIGVLTVKNAVANCPAKRIQLALQLAVSAEERESYINLFLNSARGGVCSADPTLDTFRERGWKFEYTFLLPEGGSIVRTLTC